LRWQNTVAYFGAASAAKEKKKFCNLDARKLPRVLRDNQSLSPKKTTSSDVIVVETSDVIVVATNEDSVSARSKTEDVDRKTGTTSSSTVTRFIFCPFLLYDIHAIAK
jgi:hypothetical protein